MSPRSPRRLRWWTGSPHLSLALVGAVLLAGPVAAQQTGTVVVRTVNAQTGEPLGGVQVSIANTSLGGLTNNEGRYLILNVPVGEREVVATLIGFGEQRETANVTAGGTANVEFELRARAVELEGVVVTGTAIAAQRREVGNSISLITADQIEAVGAVNFEDILRGRALGVQVSGTPGQAGAGSAIQLRGVNSVNGRNVPLIYIDGVRMPSDLPEENVGNLAAEQATFLGSINPQDIERIEVIKGAAASTLYGTEASAGVIQIFTKKGQAGAPRWTFNMQQGISRVGHVGPELDPTGLHVNDCTRQFVFNAETMDFEIENTPDPGCPSSGSWLRDAHLQEYQLSARGGSEDVTYYVSGGWNRTEGTIAPQNARQLNLRGNFTFNGFENFQITLNNMYTRRDIKWIPSGDSDESLLFNVARGAEGDTPDNDDSLVLAVEQDQFINHFNSSANVNWSQRDNLRHRLNVGLDFSNSHFITEEPWLYWDNPEGSRATDIENRRLFTLDYAGSWNSALPANFSSTLSWGGQYNQSEHLGLRGSADVFLGPGDKILQNGEEFFAQEDRDVFESGGFFLQEQIGWNNRLFVTGGLRADTHSAFGQDYTRDQILTYYPKLQATYTLSDHTFWPNWWETLRVRAAYGESGDPPGEDDAVTLFQVAPSDENRLGLIMFNQGNQEIGPERSREIEVGMDGALFNGRLAYTLTGYRQTTYDGRIFVNPPPSNGIAENIPLNVGRHESKGYEASLDIVAYEGDAVRLSVNGSYQFNETIMQELGAAEFEGFSFNYLNQYREGYPMPALFGRKLLNPDSVGVLPRWSASNEDTTFYSASRPPHEMSIGASLTLFDRVTLEAFGVGQFGHMVYDDLAQEMAQDGLWPECMPINARVEAGDLAGLTTQQISRCSEDFAFLNEAWFEDADYFRMQTATLTYRVPEAWLPGALTAATIQLQGTNLLTITNFSGLYPDALLYPAGQTARGNGFILPPPKTFTLNLRVNF